MKPGLVVTDDSPEEPSRVRLAALLGVLVVLSIVAVMVWFASDVPSAPSPVSALRQAVRLPDVWATGEPPAATLPEAVAVAASAPAGVPSGFLDVCGIGIVKESEWTGPARVEAMSASVAKVRERAAAALKARGDEASRAAGLALEAFGGRDAGESAGASRDQLARLAVGTTDPEVYALAYGICQVLGREDTLSTCRMLSAEQWARLDPGNGAPWLAVADQAQARGDRAAVAEALHRVSLATSVDAHAGRLSRRLIEQMPEGAPRLEWFDLVGNAFSLQVAGLAGYNVLASECSAAAVRDPNRQQQCAALADTLSNRGATLLDWGIAAVLGARVGWSPERLQAARDERDALMLVAKSAAGEQPLSCESIQHQTDFLGRVGRVGELEALRERVRTSGRPLADWARDGRQAREAMMRAADAASGVPLTR